MLGVGDLDGGTQLRVSLREGTVAEYAEAYRAREKLPPPVVFHEGGDWWIGDGHQRFAAARRAGIEVLLCEVRAGGRRDAILYAAGANAYHVKPVRYPDHLQLVIDLLTYWLGRVTLPYPAGTEP